MTTIDHQQAAIQAGAEAIMRAGGLERFLGTSGLYSLPVWLRAKRDSENALTAATPHLRAETVDRLKNFRNDYQYTYAIPGDPYAEGYLTACNAIIALLEGGGACCEHSKCPGGSICCCQEGGAE